MHQLVNNSTFVNFNTDNIQGYPVAAPFGKKVLGRVEPMDMFLKKGI